MLIRQFTLKHSSLSRHHLLQWMSSTPTIESLHEFKEGGRFIRQGKHETAIEYYERGLQIVGLCLNEGNANRQAIAGIVHELGQCYAWMGKVEKFKQITSRVEDEYSKESVQMVSQLRQLLEVKAVIEKNTSILSNSARKELANAYSKVPQQLTQIEQILTTKPKDGETASIDIEFLNDADVKTTFSCLLVLLLTSPNLPQNPQYNTICGALLKKAEKDSPRDIPKALLLLSVNLLRVQQNMKAEGMIGYCLDRKRQHLKPATLKQNQQSVLLNLLKAVCLGQLRRSEESERILQEYRSVFSLQKLILQSQLVDSL